MNHNESAFKKLFGFTRNAFAGAELGVNTDAPALTSKR